MSADVARAMAHLIVLLWCLYLAFDERAAGRNWRAWLWAALAAERMAILVVLTWDVWQGENIWMNYRDWLAPFVMALAISLSVYGVNRIRANRKARRAIIYAPVDNGSYVREAAW